MHTKYFLIWILLMMALSSTVKGGLESLAVEVTPSLTRLAEKSEEFTIPFAFAYGGGIQTSWKCSRHFSLGIGAHYRMKCLDIKDYPDFSNVIDDNGNYDRSRIAYANQKSKYNFYGINLTGRIIFSKAEKPKAPFYLRLGLECSDLSSIKSTTEYQTGTEVHTHHSNLKEVTLNVSSLISVGMLFPVSERIAWYAETGYAYDFYSHNYLYDYEGTRFQSVFLNLGFAYCLKKKSE